MKNLLFLLLLLSFNLVQGQNLVPNPSFEEVWTYNVAEVVSYYPPPVNLTIANFEKLIKNWTIKRYYWGNSSGGINNKFYYFKQEMIDTFFYFKSGYWANFSPRTGDSFQTLIFNAISTINGYPEFFQNEYNYISNTLTKPLEKGKVYYVEYYVKKQEEGPFNPTDSVAYIWYPSQLGLFLSDKIKPFTFQEMLTAIQKSYPQDQLPYEASVSSLANRFYGKKKNTWERVCGFYTAQGGERYLFIGNFNQKELWQESPYYGVVDVRNFPYFKQKGDYIRTNDIFMIDDVRIEEYRPGMFFKDEEQGNITICNSDLPYKIALKDEYDAYKWQNGATSKKLSITKAGTYNVEIDGFGCLIKDSININIQKKDVPQPLIKDSILCPSAFPFQTSIITPYLTSWSNGAKTNSTHFSEAGKHWVTTWNACEAKTDTFLLQKIDTSAFKLELPKRILFCDNEQLDTTLQIPSYFTNVKWENGNTTHVRKLREKGNYQVSAKNRCLEKVARFEVSHYPEQFFLADTFVCEGEKFEPNISADYDLYKWNTGDTTQNIELDSSGIYVLSAKNPCGIWSDSVSIRYIPKLNQHFENQQLSCEENIPNELVLSVSNDWNTVLWSTGEKTTSIKIKEAGVYTLQLKNECQEMNDTFSIELCPKDFQFRIETPNVITPNGDGKNECFEADFYNIHISQLQIYSRQGNLIYSSTTGVWCPNERFVSGMYYFQLIFETPSKEIKTKNGWLLLER